MLVSYKNDRLPVEGISIEVVFLALKSKHSTPFASASGYTFFRNFGPKAKPMVISVSSSRMSIGEMRSMWPCTQKKKLDYFGYRSAHRLNHRWGEAYRVVMKQANKI